MKTLQSLLIISVFTLASYDYDVYKTVSKSDLLSNNDIIVKNRDVIRCPIKIQRCNNRPTEER